MTESINQHLDISFEKNEFSLVSNSFINTKEYNKELKDFEYDESSYKNMAESLEKLVISQEKEYESKITLLSQTVESLQNEVVFLNEVLTNKEKEITNYQNSSKEMEIDSSLNRSTLSENRNNSNTGRMRFEREWSYDIKQKDDSLYGYIKNKVDTNLTKKESILRKHGYAVVSRKEDKSIINNISKPKKISTLQRLNASANSDWETRWERKWFANEFKDVENSRNLLKEIDNAYVYKPQQLLNKSAGMKFLTKLHLDILPIHNDVVELENMITNLNKNHSVLERKIMNLMAEKSQLKELNTNLTINILNQQKIIKDYENILAKSQSYYKDSNEMNYDWSSLFQKMTNIDQYSRELILTIESSLQNNKLQPKIDKMTVILMALKQNFKEKNNRFLMKKTSSMKFSPRFPTLDDESNKENIHNNNNENEKKPKEFPRFKDSPNILISPKVRSVSDFKEKLSEEKYFFKSNYLLNEEKEKIGKELDNLKKTKGRINEKDDIIQNQEKTGDKTNVTYKKSKDLLNFMNRIDEKNSKKKRDDFNLSNLSKSEKKIARIDNQDYSFENSDENDVKYYNLLEEYKQLEDKFNNLKKNNQTLSFNLKNTKNEEIPKENLSLKEKETGETNNHKNYKELEKKYFNLVEQHSSLEKDYKILNIKENSSLNELYQQKNSILDLFEKNAISQKEIFTLRNQQDSILKQKEDEIKELRKYQSSLLDDLEKNKILIKDLKTNEYVLLELIRNKEEEINDLRINQSSLIKDSLDNSNQDYKVLEKNYQDLCQDFTSLKKESDVLKNAQELLLKLIRNKENKIDEYEKKCIILSKEKVNLQNEIKDLNSVLNASADEKKISDKEIERLNNCLITIREENSNCNKEIETLNNCLNAINHEKNNHIKIKEDFKNLLNPISDENNYSDNNEKKNLKYFLNQNNINETKNVESKSEILNFNKDIHFMKLKLNEQIIFNELSKIKNLYDELNDKHLRLLKEKSEIENNFRNFQESQEEESESNKKQKQVIIGKLLKLTQEKLDIESSFKNFKDFKEKELQSLNLNQYEEIHIKYLKLKEDFMNFRLLKEKEISEKLKTFEEFEKEMFTLNEMKDKLEATVILLNKKILDLQLEKNESTDENNNLILAKKELEDEILAIKLKYNNISTNIQQFNDSIKEKNIKNEGESKIASKHDSIEKNLIDIDYNKELFLKEQNSKKKMKNDEAFDLLLMKFKDYKLSNLTKKSELPYKLDIKNEKISGNDIETVMKMLKIDHQKSKRKLKCFYENLLGELLSSYINFIENLMKSSQITQISKISVDFLQNEEKIKDGLRTKFNDLRNNFGKFKEYIKEIGEKEVEWLHSIYGAKAASFIDLNIFSEFYQNQKNSILLKN